MTSGLSLGTLRSPWLGRSLILTLCAFFPGPLAHVPLEYYPHPLLSSLRRAGCTAPSRTSFGVYCPPGHGLLRAEGLTRSSKTKQG